MLVYEVTQLGAIGTLFHTVIVEPVENTELRNRDDGEIMFQTACRVKLLKGFPFYLSYQKRTLDKIRVKNQVPSFIKIV